ncbi:hypothetical protein GQ457_04G018910 [Hibiscus cannabinus]
MTRANPRGQSFDFDLEIERTQRQLKRRIRGLMNVNMNNGQQPADGQELPARADGANNCLPGQYVTEPTDEPTTACQDST